MTAANQTLDRSWIRGLSGSELLLLRLRNGKSVAATVEAELNRRSRVVHGNLDHLPQAAEVAELPSRGIAGGRSRRSHAA